LRLRGKVPPLWEEKKASRKGEEVEVPYLCLGPHPFIIFNRRKVKKEGITSGARKGRGRKKNGMQGYCAVARSQIQS